MNEDRLAHLLGARPLGVFDDPFVGQRGQHPLLHLLQLQFVGRDDALADRRVHLEVFARLETEDQFVDALGDRAGADGIHEVRHVEWFSLGRDLLDVHVHRHQVAGHDRPVDGVQHSVGLEVAVDLGVDLTVGDDG